MEVRKAVREVGRFYSEYVECSGRETVVLHTEIVVNLDEWRKLLEREGGKQNLEDNQLVESRRGRKASMGRPRKHLRCKDCSWGSRE